MSAEEIWEFNLKRALLLISELRMKGVVQRIDPRAMRVALKYALLVDTYIAEEAGQLTEEKERMLDSIAQQLFEQTDKGEKNHDGTAG